MRNWGRISPAIALAVAGSIAGCQSGTTTAGAGGGASGTPSAGPSMSVAPMPLPGRSVDVAMARCRVGDLSARVTLKSLASGTAYANLTLTDVSVSPCYISGYPVLAEEDAARDPIATTPNHDVASTPARQVDLVPGAAASATIGWSTTPAGDEPAGACEPAASFLSVTLPGDTAQIAAAVALTACRHGDFDVTALVPGTSGPTPG